MVLTVDSPWHCLLSASQSGWGLQQTLLTLLQTPYFVFSYFERVIDENKITFLTPYKYLMLCYLEWSNFESPLCLKMRCNANRLQPWTHLKACQDLWWPHTANQSEGSSLIASFLVYLQTGSASSRCSVVKVALNTFTPSFDSGGAQRAVHGGVSLKRTSARRPS